MDMIEKVARAIYASSAFHDNLDSINPRFDSLGDEWRAVMFASARAAIEAMREPTEAMNAAGHVCLPHGGYMPHEREAGYVWEAMISAALTPPPSGEM